MKHQNKGSRWLLGVCGGTLVVSGVSVVSCSSTSNGTSPDLGVDAAQDVTVDAPSKGDANGVTPESGTDAGTESGTDAGTESGTDAGTESGTDAGPEMEAGGGDAEIQDATDGGADSDAGAVACVTGAPDGGTNLISDPGFESGADAGAGWFAANGGGVFAVTSTEAHCGGDSGEVSGRTQTYQGLGYNLPDTGATPVTYAVSLWVLQDGGGTIQIGVQGSGICGDAARNYFNVAFPFVPANTWVQATGTLTLPADCTANWLQIVQNTTIEAGAEFPDLFVDDVYVNQ